MDCKQAEPARAEATVPPGRLPTIIDVARQAGVSKSLVSSVLRDSPHVSAANRGIVRAAAAELGYRPNAAAQSLVRGSTGLIGVLIPDMTNPFYAEIVGGAEDAAEAAGRQLMLGITRFDPRRLAGWLDSLLNRRVEGLIVSTWGFDGEVVRRAAATVPTVLIGEPGPNVGDVDVINADDEYGAKLAVRHLIDLGHRRVAHVNMRPQVRLKVRSQAYVDTMTEAGLASEIELVNTGLTFGAGRDTADLLLRRPSPPTAVFAISDIVAIGMLSRFAELGVRVPEDVAVAGYNNIALAEMWSPSLTTVQQSGSEMGALAVRAIKARHEGVGPLQINTIRPTLIVRHSTVSPKS